MKTFKEFISEARTPEQRAKEKERKKRRKENIKITTSTELSKKERTYTNEKIKLAKKREMDHHHINPLHISAEKMRDMAQSEREEFLRDEAKKRRYHGNHPRNISIASRGKKDTYNPLAPGLHHAKYHSFATKNRARLDDISNAITPQRSFTVLQNRERRLARQTGRTYQPIQQRPRPSSASRRRLLSRMAAGAKKSGIE